jgi:hypothetical protein
MHREVTLLKSLTMLTISDVPTQLHKHSLTPATDSRLPLVVHANISSTSTKQLLLQADTHIETDSGGYKRTDTYIGWRKEVTAMLLEYGLDKQARLFYDCAEHPKRWIPSDRKTLHSNAATVWLCSEDPTHPAAMFMSTCDLRICPDCAARQTARLAARYIPKAIELSKVGGRYHLRHIVFTTPIELTSDTPEKINAEIERLSRLPRQTLDLLQEQGELENEHWKTFGCIQSAEFGTDGLKLHFHVIQYGDYIPQKKLSEAWMHVTGGLADVVYIRAIKTTSPEDTANDVIETLKYSVKFWKTDKKTGQVHYLPANVMPHLLLTLKGLRRIRSWGCFYGLPKPKKEPFCCSECNKEMERIGCENWYLWIEHGATGEQIRAWKRESLLHLKLANKSHFSGPDGNKPPPDYSSKDRQIQQKSLFTDDFKTSENAHYSIEDKF